MNQPRMFPTLTLTHARVRALLPFHVLVFPPPPVARLVTLGAEGKKIKIFRLITSSSHVVGPPPLSSPLLLLSLLLLLLLIARLSFLFLAPRFQSFSSVVGPNGSGKSNVIDAMLFVFGKRAKQLRLNKVSELIHNSTDFRNLEYARVEVHFHEIIDKEGEDFEAVPDSDFVISREAYRNNTSKYFIDKKTSNFTEVTNLLKGHGVDLNNNRFLILQGEVEQISMMKPKALTPNDEGLLEYLEDIIGTNQYVEHIELKAKALEELNEKRGSQVNRLKLVEKERNALDGAKQARIRRINLRDAFITRMLVDLLYYTTPAHTLSRLFIPLRLYRMNCLCGAATQPKRTLRVGG